MRPDRVSVILLTLAEFTKTITKKGSRSLPQYSAHGASGQMPG
jgi:hypothetical protein